MSVSNGQNANQSTFNTAFMSRTGDTSTVGEVEFLNYTKRNVEDSIVAHAGGGQGSAFQLTKNINIITTCATAGDSVKLPAGKAGMEIRVFNQGVSSLNVFPATGEQVSGFSVNAAAAVPAGDDVVFICRSTGLWRISQPKLSILTQLLSDVAVLYAKFDPSTGHDHDGVDSAGISGFGLNFFNRFFVDHIRATKTGVTGGSANVSSVFTLKAPGGDEDTAGVITDSPENRVEIRDSNTGQAFTDSNGRVVYGRLTHSGSTWTLTFYVFDAGSDLAYTFLSTEDIYFYYREVFNQDTRPTFPANVAEMIGAGGGGGGGSGGNGSLLTWEMPDADGPVEVKEYGLPAYEFSQSTAVVQSLWTVIEVPSTYEAGTQILLEGMSFWTPATSGDVYFRVLRKLLRAGTTDMSSAMGSSFFEAQLTASASANRLTTMNDIELTTSLGKIDSVDVAPGDFIVLNLQRRPDQEPSAAADVVKVLKSNGRARFTV